MQGRFKRDGSSAAAEPERGGTDRGSSAQHAQNPGPVPSGDSGPGAARAAGGGSLPPAAAKASGSSGGKSPSGPGSRIALRNWRISTRLVSLLALPVITATSLGALRINESMDEIQQLDNMKLLTDMTKQATELASALQEERDRSAGPLAHGAKPSDYVVKGARQKTDRAYNRFLQGTQDLDDTEGDKGLLGVRANTVEITQQLQKINDVRKNAYKDPTSTSQTVDAYSQLIEQLLALSSDMAQATSNPDMIQRTRALTAFSSAKEYASVQRAIIAAALPAGDSAFGKISETDRRYGFSALDKENSELDAFKGIYAGTADELTKPIDGGNASIKGADSYAKRVLEQEGGIKLQDKRSYKDWVDNDTTKIDAMSKIELTLLNEMEQKARELRNESEQTAILNGALILLVLGVSLVGAFVVARSMIRSLRRLQDTATKVAQDRLPELVKQLSESDPQDVDTSVESVGVHSRDEIGQVAAAFDDVHREAVRLAAEQALLRGNVNAMFTNLSRRSQGLIQRQLSLISELESREADPDQLSSLFKLDHLATRMRRNGENLLVLAGEEPGRRWTRPVPLVDVLRAAASEVEQYERIELASVPTTEVAGRVVNDLVHLLAELLENATSFSSPQTKVKVTGHALPDGRVLIEIHDTGIGLSPEDLAAINERLASPPTVDVSVSRRMGLFVVGRLSQRHGIRIQLRPSDSGGTTALVMLPVDVAQGGKKVPGKPGAPGQGGGPAAAQAAGGVAAARRGVGAGNGGPGSAGPAGSAGRLGAGAPRGQVTGTGPRAALPSRDSGPGQAPGQGQGQGPRAGSPSAPVGPTGSQQGGNGSLFEGRPDAGRGAGSAPLPPVPQQRTNPVNPAGNVPNPANASNDAGDQGRRPQLPPRGGPRAELPGGNPQPRVPSWSDENAQPQVSREPFDAPRGHEEPETTGQFPQPTAGGATQGPGATAEFARPDFNGPPPGAGSPSGAGQQGQQNQQGTGQFVRPDVFGGQDSSGTGQFERPGTSAPRRGPGQGGPGQGQGGPGQGGGQLGVPPQPSQSQQPSQPPQQPQLPARSQQPQQPVQPDELPPAGPGDGRTPLFDTLETNWFQQQQEQEAQRSGGAPQSGGNSGGNRPAEPAAPAPEQPRRPQRPQPSSPSSPPPSRPQAQQPQSPAGPPRPAAAPAANQAGGGGNGANVTNGSSAAWRTSPNDELGRQAERVRQPSAGGVTTSGLPRRVPRANLVAGTAQQQQDSTGPQVSRAPDDVRGRLTNLRRGIQQGRQAGTGQTGSFPTHQQER
ncbi:nitrate- and nitrite sensing domain-containing protein [Streptomyces sp. NBC_01381]|uniref:sensor histidine kinase n=1 Tax=Streptomyces sp. NBC_01381 TaxID=2903845 RepID=UPI0022557FFE|nr:sensor histidine kinase [Streptomyces sp. NBC_01381]MCX4670254.1 nitrate- and nitrite sensing domain-containing protein [Streptomyces sp. NBC_01381]